MKNKKIKLCAVTSLSLACVVIAGATLMSKHPYSILAEGIECNHEGYHYQELAPTDSKEGHKEYYSCCKCHNSFLTKPSGSFADQEDSKMVGGLADGHVAYLPNLNTTWTISSNLDFDDGFKYGYHNMVVNANLDFNNKDGQAGGYIQVKKGNNQSLDLNGKTLTYSSNIEGADAFIYVKGSLEIKSSKANGKIAATYSKYSTTATYSTNTISNSGTLKVSDNVILENLSDGSASYALDNYGGSTTTISGGTFNAVHTAVRNFASNADSSMTINGGTFHSTKKYAYTAQHYDANAFNLTINGGTFTSDMDDDNYGYSILIMLDNKTHNKFHMNVNGGTFNDYIYFSNSFKTADITFAGGRFFKEIYMGDCLNVVPFVTGGTYNVIDSSFVKNGYSIIDNGDGTYTVSEKVTTVNNAAEAQEALDKADNNKIVFKAGNYGVLYIRQSELSLHIENKDWAGGADVRRYRSINNVKLVAEEGATIEAIVVEALTYTSSGNQHSKSAEMPYLMSHIQINNLSFEGFTFNFNGKPALNLADCSAGFDGISFKNCTFNGDNTSRIIFGNTDSAQTLTVKDTTNTVEISHKKNLSFDNCNIKDVYQVANFNSLDGLSITNCTIDNCAAHMVLLTVDKGPNNTGLICIKNNTIINQNGERMLRLTNPDAATIEIEDNSLSQGHNEEFVKITGSLNGTTFSFKGNSWTDTNTSTTYTDEEAITAKKIVY